MNGPENLIDPPVDTAALPVVVNHTRLPSQYYQMVDVSDDVFHVVVVRSTYDMYRANDQGQLLLADEQTALVDSDQFYGVVNESSLVCESDYAPFKPRCDILFAHAFAHAPDSKPASHIADGVRVGDWQKSLQAVGPRHLKSGLLGWTLSEPLVVSQVPIRYEQAWGGTCRWPEQAIVDTDPEILESDECNPIGSAFVDKHWLKKSRVSHMDAPQIEALGRSFKASDVESGSYPVVGLGAIGRWWQPRRSKVGTYDEAWKRERWPRLPMDFDFSYWNCAPEDQQIDYPSGGEQVVMIGLNPGGEMRFRLPVPDTKLLLHLSAGVPMFKLMPIDTILFDLQAMRLIIVQRALIAAKADVEKIEIGTWDYKSARTRNAAVFANPAAISGG